MGMLNGRVQSDNPWHRTEMEVEGIPDHWENADVANVWLDAHQFAFQNYKQGNLSEDFFEELRSAWNIDLNGRTFSEKPIRCYVHVAFGKDAEGKLKYIVDTNNNLDFADEAEREAAELIWPPTDAAVRSYVQKLKYETFRNGAVVELEAPLLIVQSRGELWSNVPQLAEAELDNVKIKLVSDGFQSLSFSEATLHLGGENEEIKQNEFMRLSGKIYQNLGVNSDRQVLRLKEVPNDSLIFSSQVGFVARPFSGKDFITQQDINLERFKGKFLYLDFWGSWCKPCLAELPQLKEAYWEIDTSKVAFLGVANDKAERLANTLEKEGIDWKQILCEQEEGIIDDYNITGYPTSFLIDPMGVIVAKNVRAEDLLDTLRFYTGAVVR